MAKREISSTLRNLKFMQRSALKEENKKKIDDDEPDANFIPSASFVSKKCVVITDWDPQPGALLGRMSFQSFNPSIEKLNEEASPTIPSSNEGRIPFSEPKVETSGDLKRKQSVERVSEEPNHPSKSPRGSDKPSPSNKKDNGFKKPKSWQPKPHSKH